MDASDQYRADELLRKYRLRARFKNEWVTSSGKYKIVFCTIPKKQVHLFKKAMEEGGVQLLEPIGHLTVTVPSDLMGDITGDINKRRGRVLGMNPGEKYLVVEADVPMSEMHKYTTDLRSMTQGRGKFEFEFVRYEIAPKEVEQKVVADANK